MKSLEDFLNLTDEEQTDLFYEIGKHIDTVKAVDAVYFLYSMKNFYVELTMSPDERIIQRFSLFTGGARLDKYTKDLKKTSAPWE